MPHERNILRADARPHRSPLLGHCIDAAVITSPHPDACSCSRLDPATNPTVGPRYRRTYFFSSCTFFLLAFIGAEEILHHPCGPVQPRTAEIDPCPATPFAVACRAPSPDFIQRPVGPRLSVMSQRRLFPQESMQTTSNSFSLSATLSARQPSI